MGGKKSPKVKYKPAPPPPKVQEVPTQSFRTQIELTKVSNEQQRLNMELGAELDRTNEEFFAGQDVRRLQAKGSEDRATIGKTGEEERATIGKTAEEQRLTNLQQEQFRRYQEERDYQQSRSAYRS